MSENSTSSVERAEMDKAAKKIADRAQEIKTIQSNLQGQMTGLMGGWEGNAAKAFDSAYQGFNSRFTTTLNTLNELHEKLVSSQIDYTTREDENQAATNQITSLLS